MDKNDIYNFFKTIAIIGNILFILWMLYNGMDEGFKAGPVELVSIVGLIGLLILNTILIARKK